MFGKIIQYGFLFTLLITWTAQSSAQEDTTIHRQVEVVKDYTPAVMDANKISEMPEIGEEKHEKPSFSYSIFSRPVFNTFSVNTLKAATFASAPEADTGFGLVKAGLGTYNRPYGELFFNSQRVKNTLFGLHGKHLSSHGKLTLDGGDKVKAPFAENEAEIFVKHLFRKAVLSVNLGFDHEGFNYYGYPQDSVPGFLLETSPEDNYFGRRQTFSKGSLNINLENPTARRNDFKFDFDFLYHYFGAKTGQREHFGDFTADVNKPFDSGIGFLKAGVTFVREEAIFNRNLQAVGANQQIWLTAQPGYEIGGDVARLRMGLKGWFVLDDDTTARAKIAPDIRVDFSPVKEIITVFAGVDGQFVNNHYSKIAAENPFVDPLHDVENSFEKFHFYGGFDGKFAAKTNFKLGVDYSMIRDKPLYYLYKYSADPPEGSAAPSPTPLMVVENDFDVLYDDTDLLKFNAEIFHAAFDKMNLLIAGNYYLFQMEKQQSPWNLPEWDAQFSLDYQVSQQLSVSTDLFLTGRREALIIAGAGKDSRPLSNKLLMEQVENGVFMTETYTLDPVFDMNFSASYQLSPQFSVFARLHNFGFQKYQRWLGYPVHNFNVLAGLSYAF